MFILTFFVFIQENIYLDPVNIFHVLEIYCFCSYFLLLWKSGKTLDVICVLILDILKLVFYIP